MLVAVPETSWVEFSEEAKWFLSPSTTFHFQYRYRSSGRRWRVGGFPLFFPKVEMERFFYS